MSIDIDFCLKALELKRVVRTGWVMHDIPKPETVSSHSWGVAFLALIVPLPEGCDRSKLVHMAVLHDLAEVSTGDVVVEGDERLKRARDAHEVEFFSEYFAGDDKAHLRQLALDACAFEGVEGEMLEQLDKVDMAFQAFVYSRDTGKDLSRFFDSSRRAIKDADLLHVVNELQRRLTSVDAKDL